MAEYSANSFKSKEPQELVKESKKLVEEKDGKLAPVVKSETTTKKQSTMEKLGNRLKDAGKFILDDVLIPSAKKLIADSTTNFVNNMVYGSNVPRRDNYTPYASNYRGSTYPSAPSYVNDYSRPTRRSQYNYDNIFCKTEEDAMSVLSSARRRIEAKGSVSLGDVLDLAKLPNEWTDYNYGWCNLRNAEIVNMQDGWFWVKLPKPMPITNDRM